MPGASQQIDNTTERRRSSAHMEGEIVGDERIQFQLLNKLGNGGFGTVYRARCLTRSSRPFAIKVVERGTPGTSQYTSHRFESDFHTRLRHHPNIIGYFGHLADASRAYFLMDYCPGGDLRHAICNRRIFARNNALVKTLFLQLLDAVQACHDAEIYHRDIKPDNILINQEMTEVYLTDFGLSTSAPQSMAFGVGTSLYMSPECLNPFKDRFRYNTKRADTWALGITLVNMLTGRHPWSRAEPSDPRYRDFLMRDNYLQDMLPISHEVVNLLKKVFRHNEEDSIDLPTFRKTVEGITTFFMTDEEIEGAGHYARTVAAEYLRPISKEQPPPLARQLVNIDEEWSQGLPLFLSLWDSESSESSSGSSGGRTSSSSQSLLGFPNQGAVSLIPDPSTSGVQIAWGREKTAPMHMRPYSFRGSSEESTLSTSGSESGICSLGSDDSPPDSKASTRRIGRSFPWNVRPGVETAMSEEGCRNGGTEAGPFVQHRQTHWSRLTTQFRRLFGSMS